MGIKINVMKNNDPCTFKNNENKILQYNDEYGHPRKLNIDLYLRYTGLF